MAKRLLIMVLMGMVMLSAAAQTDSQSLIVYEVSGNVFNKSKAQKLAVAKKQFFSFKDRISIPENGFIKLLDKENRKMYTLRNECEGRISELIAKQKDAGKNLTTQYFAYVLKSLTRKDTDGIYDTGLTTATFRNDADSLLCDIDSLQTVVDSLQNVINTLKADSLRKK